MVCLENDLENIFFTIPLFLIHIFPVFNQTDDNHQGLVAQEDDINDNADDDDNDDDNAYDDDADDDDDADADGDVVGGLVICKSGIEPNLGSIDCEN